MFEYQLWTHLRWYATEDILSLVDRIRITGHKALSGAYILKISLNVI